MVTMSYIGDDPNPLLQAQPGVPVAVDIETTGLTYLDDILGVAMAWDMGQGLRSCYIYKNLVQGDQMSFDHMFLKNGETPTEALLRHTFAYHVVFMHNEAFDYRLLHRDFRVNPPANGHDTSHLALLSAPYEKRSLAMLVATHLDLPDWYAAAKHNRKSLSKVPLGEVAKYARADAEFTLLLGRDYLFPAMRRVVKPGMYHRDRKFSKLVMRMMGKGMRVDLDWIKTKRSAMWDRMEVIERTMKRRGLSDIASNHDVAFYLFKTLKLPMEVNLTKNKNAHWPRGVPSVDKEALDNIRHLAPEDIGMIIEHRQISKGISSWLNEYEAVSKFDGRVHSILAPFGTVSYRMSSSQPAMQAIPMEDRGTAFGSMMGMLIGDTDDEELYGFDLKQAEPRMAAILSGDNLLAAALEEGDPYINMATRVWNDPSRRNDAKRALLASIYEIGAKQFSYKHKISEQEAYNVLDQFRRALPKLRSASVKARHDVEKNPVVYSYAGRPRWFAPSEPAYKGFNQMVQMSVAELMQAAMHQVEKVAPGLMILQVHDAVIASIPRGEGKEEVKRIIQTAMETAFDEYRDNYAVKVPLIAEGKPWQ
jgi:DNA polymerase I-like protein with 3'-5' exonuclease and polymerase domains